METFRKDFPILSKKINGKPIVYFDNACVTLRPKQVIDAVTDYYTNFPACAGRSSHTLGETVSKKVDESRKTIASFLGARRKEEIIFTRNTTEAINLVANSFPFVEGDVILTSDKEHNSNLVPWQIQAKKRGIIHKVIALNEDNTFNLDNLERLLHDGRVKLVALGLTSNLDGVSIPAEKIIEMVQRHGAYVLLDAAQTVPHRKINVHKLGADFVAFSGHKMLGPSGIGVLYGKFELLENLAPFLVGGGTVLSSTYEGHEFLPLPERFEAGLQDYAGIIGLAEAVRYLENIGFEKIAEHELKLNKIITDEILKINGAKIIGPSDPALRGGIISFTIDGIDSHQIAIILNESSNVMIRSGQHCVHSWFNARKIKSSARVSLYFYNTMDEVKIFAEGLSKIVAINK